VAITPVGHPAAARPLPDLEHGLGFEASVSGPEFVSVHAPWRPGRAEPLPLHWNVDPHDPELALVSSPFGTDPMHPLGPGAFGVFPRCYITGIVGRPLGTRPVVAWSTSL
jgi:hypothetical protein